MQEPRRASRPDGRGTASRKGYRKMELYAWQRKCLKKWEENGYRGIADVVTGAGKTVLALEGACMLSEKYPGRLRVRIVTPTVSLAGQWAKAVREYEGTKTAAVGIYNGQRKDAYDGQYTVYVVNSARYALARHILEDMKAGYHVLLIADECHRYAGAENRKIFDFMRQPSCFPERYHCLGMSATPRFDEEGLFLEWALGREIYHYRFREAVREGTVSRFFVYQIGLSFSADELRAYDQLSSRMGMLYYELQARYPELSGMGGHALFRFLNRTAAREGEDSPAAVYVGLSYQRAAVSYDAAARSACACELIRRTDPAAQILVFCERISQADELRRRLQLCGIGRVGSYHSRMPERVRKRVLGDFRDGEVRILISCKALDEGIDVPDAAVGIVMSGTSMSRQRIQRIGRILRRRKDKPWACLYYLYVRESAEDSTFLMEYKGSETSCSLSYNMQENVFIFKGYEEAAAGLLQEAAERGAQAPVLKELRRCLLLGILRPDWMTDPEELEHRMQAEAGRRERNYLLCMKRMAEMRSGNGNT